MCMMSSPKDPIEKKFHVSRLEDITVEDKQILTTGWYFIVTKLLKIVNVSNLQCGVRSFVKFQLSSLGGNSL